MTQKDVNVDFDIRTVLPIYRDMFFDYDTRWTLLWGSRASGKTKVAFQKLLMKSLKSERRVLLLRRTNNKIMDTIWLEAMTILDEWGLKKFVTINKSEQTITFDKLNGTVWTFRGGDEPERLKGMIISDVYFDELSEFNAEIVDLLNATLRSKRYGSLQILATTNPTNKTNFLYTYFSFDLDKVPNNTRIIHSTWHDNPYLDDSFAIAMADLKERNYRKWLRDSEGEWVAEGKTIYNNWDVEKLDKYELLKENPNLVDCYAIDVGFNHPYAICVSLVDEETKTIYVVDEYYRRESTDEDAYKWICRSGYGRNLFIIDSAAPINRETLHRLGLRVKGSKKGHGSVLSGISKIQDYKIIIDERCTNFIDEISNYCWKQDKNGNYTDEPVKVGDDLMDAFRYSLENVIGKKKCKIITVRL